MDDPQTRPSSRPHSAESDAPSPAYDALTPARTPDLVYTLVFEQLKQLTAVAVAAAAGALILLQMGFARADPVSILGILAILASVVLAMDAQDSVVDHAVRGVPPGKLVSIRRRLASVLLLGGAAAFLGYNLG